MHEIVILIAPLTSFRDDQSRSRVAAMLRKHSMALNRRSHASDMSSFTRRARDSSLKGLVSRCIPRSRWPWLRIAFSA